MKIKLLTSAALALSIAISTPASFIPSENTTYHVDAATYKKVFKDVTTSNPNYHIIHEMAKDGIIKGYSDHTFRGANHITRYQVATLIYRHLGDAIKTTNANVKIPSDVSAKNEHYNATVKLLQANLLQVDTKGKLNPNKPITRGEMAKILATVFAVENKEEFKDFSDISKLDNSTKNAIRALRSSGITTGYIDDNTFRPNNALTRQQFAVFMYRAIEMQEAGKAAEDEKPVVVAPETEETIKDNGNTTAPEIIEEEQGTTETGNNTTTKPFNIYEISTDRTPDSAWQHYKPVVFTKFPGKPVDPKVSGMTASELKAYQKAASEIYFPVIQIQGVAGIFETHFTEKDYINKLAKIIGSKEKVYSLLNYLITTGAVYKGDIILYYTYSEKNPKFTLIL